MPYPQRIGIAGPMQGGKSTLAALLAERIEATIHPFAAPLKRMAMDLGWNGKKDQKGRKLLQLLGTEVCRGCIADDYWITQWEETTEGEASMYVIADDVRFDNEANMIRERGVMVYVMGRQHWTHDHASEQPPRMGPRDIIINNAGDMYQLEQAASTLDAQFTGMGV